MKHATITEAKNRLSALIDQVRAGETIIITDRGRPVAQLAPPLAADEDTDWRIAELERAGIIRRASRPPLRPDELPPPIELTGVLDALLEERREGW